MAQLTITTSPTQLTSPDGKWNYGPDAYLSVRVLTAGVTVFISDGSDSAVTPLTGWPLQPGEVLTLRPRGGERFYAVVETGTASVAVLRSGHN